MRTCNKFITAASLITLLGGLSGLSAIATTPIVYPAKNQTPQQQQKDEGECATWAKQTTGIDPAVVAAAPVTPAPATTSTAEPEKSSGPKGQRAKGAAKGAAAGAVIGEVADNDADQGAATGAAVGAIAGGSRARRDRREQEDQATKQAAGQQQAAEHQVAAEKQQQLDTYGRARSACLEGRGYVLN